MAISEQDACEAVRSQLNESADIELSATAIPNTSLLTVSGHNAGSPIVGAGWIVGPDGQVWTLSSNSAIHEFEVAVSLIDDIYRANLAAQVDQELLSKRLRLLTTARRELVADVLREAKAGQLKAR